MNPGQHRTDNATPNMKTKHHLFTLTVAVIAAVLSFQPSVRAAGIILTSDDQLRALLDPDAKIDMSTGYNHVEMSLREVCEAGKKRGDRTLTIAFDEFFRQYRPQAGTERKLTPDQDEYVQIIKTIGDFAKKYGMGLCLSLMSPLELGPAYRNQTGEAGRWLGYKVGPRNASDGSFTLDIWEQMYWTNNKGKVRVELKGVKAYAFKQKTLGASHRIAVNPDDIVELKDVRFEAGDIVDVASEEGGYGIKQGPNDMIFPVRRLRVYSEGGEVLPDLNRVMVVLEYETPEMDYFSDLATPFIHGLMDKYKNAGIQLDEFYSDEMHIQQDWAYFSHHEGGQFAMRYLTKAMSEKYKARYGQALDEKYMLYFVYGAPYYEATAGAVNNVQYVMGETPADIHRTYLLRDRYYKMLNNGVVDLFIDGKEYAEKLFGHEFRTSAHSSWAESPTIDLYNTEKLPEYAAKYDYTSNYVWGNTVHQACAACYDYFKWGEYLQPTGNDFAECGWGDRDYYGAAMGTSIGVINKYPNAYAAAWGFPAAALHWKMMLNYAYGASPDAMMRLMTGSVHRDIEVLMVYPMNLVAVEERFGSWMTQYGYANYLPSEKLVEMGSIGDDGWMHVAAKKYNTIAVMFEPLPSKGFLDLLEKFAQAGGKVVWFSAPPLIDGEGAECIGRWNSLFGCEYVHDMFQGELAPGKEVAFEGSFASVPSQVILTDMLVDRIYPLKSVAPGSEVIAKVGKHTVGVRRRLGKGEVFFFGFRPRDDQSRSLGYETRTLFEILNAAGTYPSSGKFPVNDNPTVVSRTTDVLATSFPNGATAIVKHYRTHEETWAGGFSRDPEADAKALALNPMPSDALDLEDLCVNGHRISYKGKCNVAFNTDEAGRLMAFNGTGSSSVTLDGTEYVLADRPVSLCYGPLNGDKSHFRVWADRTCSVTLPLPAGAKKVTVKDGKATVKTLTLADGCLQGPIAEGQANRWLDVTVKY